MQARHRGAEIVAVTSVVRERLKFSMNTLGALHTMQFIILVSFSTLSALTLRYAGVKIRE